MPSDTGLTEVSETSVCGGIPLYVWEMPSAAVAAVACCIRTGARYEPPGRGGITHLLEHLMLRSSSARASLPQELELLGGEANALTSKEELVVYGRVPAEAVEAAVGLTAACVATPTLPLEELEAERRVIVSELEEALGDPAEAVHDAAFSAVFGPHPLALPPGGRPETVRALTAEQVDAYRAERLVADNLAFAVVGPASPQLVVEALELSPLAEVERASWRPESVGPARTPRSREPLRQSIASQYAYVALAVEGFAFADARVVAADVIATLLCRSSRSLLYEAIRERRALSYAIGGWHRPYTDTGIFRITIGTLPEHAAEVVELSRELVAQKVEQGWTEGEVASARKQTWGQLVLDLESSEESAIHFARQRFVGRLDGWTPADYRRSLGELTAEEVNVLAREWLGDGMTAAEVGGF